MRCRWAAAGAFLSHLPAVADGILGGWSISGITTLQKGLPFTPTISVDQANTGVGGQRPNVIAQPIVVANVACWFYVAANPGCQALVPGTSATFAIPAQYTYGIWDEIFCALTAYNNSTSL